MTICEFVILSMQYYTHWPWYTVGVIDTCFKSYHGHFSTYREKSICWKQRTEAVVLLQKCEGFFQFLVYSAQLSEFRDAFHDISTMIQSIKRPYSKKRTQVQVPTLLKCPLEDNETFKWPALGLCSVSAPDLWPREKRFSIYIYFFQWFGDFECLWGTEIRVGVQSRKWKWK